MKARYIIELDFFSGQQNPWYEITKEEFEGVYNEVITFEKDEPNLFFDGLGFRGIILSETNLKSVYIQNKVIKLEILNNVKHFKSNREIILRAINLFKNHDIEGNYKILVKEAKDEYL